MIRPDIARREEIFIERRSDGVPLDGQVVLFEQFALLKRTWKWVLAVSLVIAAAAGAYVILYVPKEYKATIRVVPPNKAGSPLDNIIGGLTSSLRDFGLGKLVGGKSGESGYSRVSLLFSRSMIDSLMTKYDLYADYDIDRDRPDLLAEAIRDNIDVEVDLEGPIDISIYDRSPQRAAQMTQDLVRFADNLSRELNRRETEPISRTIGRRYEQVRDEQESITTRLRSFMQENKIFDVEKQGSIVGEALYEAEAQVRMQKIIVDALAQTLGEEDARVIEQRGVLRSLQAESSKLAAGKGNVLDGPSVKNAPSAAVEGIRLQTAYEINAKLLALLQPMYEQSVLDQSRDIPIFHVVDAPTVPLKKARPRYSLVIAGAFLGAWIVCYVVIAIIAYARAFNRRYRAYALTVGGNGLPRN